MTGDLAAPLPGDQREQITTPELDPTNATDDLLADAAMEPPTVAPTPEPAAQPRAITGRCVALDHLMYLDADLSSSQDADEDAPFRHPDYFDVCNQCIEDGFVPAPSSRRRDIVVENCEFYAASGIGLTEAADREGYSDRSHLDSVLRRWGRLDLAHTLADFDPILVRDRPFQ